MIVGADTLGRITRESILLQETERTPLPAEVSEPETLPTAGIIARLITKYYEGAYEYGRVDSIKLADREIRPDQRFYDVEFRQAAHILETRSPTSETWENWYALMKDYAGYRITEQPFCSYGQEPDPVTRKCVTKRPDRPDRAPVIAQPAPDGTSNGTGNGNGNGIEIGLILPLGIVGILALVMLGGNR